MDAPFKVLHDLRNPPFVADPEFAPFDVGTLVRDPKSAPASPRPYASLPVKTPALIYRSKGISNFAAGRGTTLALRSTR